MPVSIFKSVSGVHLKVLQALRTEFLQLSSEQLYRRYLDDCPAFVTFPTFLEHLMQTDLIRLESALANIRMSPEPLDERTEELKQHYEMVLCQLESEFVAALLSGDWSKFDDYVSMFRHETEQETEHESE